MTDKPIRIDIDLFRWPWTIRDGDMAELGPEKLSYLIDYLCNHFHFMFSNGVEFYSFKMIDFVKEDRIFASKLYIHFKKEIDAIWEIKPAYSKLFDESSKNVIDFISYKQKKKAT